ncbi:hypothetical protein [Paraburkholderia atlantica]|uniref:hypothetical protein n=1 Tax=Paraburkholderia atlantica TaxID=2654982 RepID=UPI00037B7D05|nr:hypothetical protein [Paraburkholderia atlantica]
MNRVHYDNSLLAACDNVHGKLAKAFGMMLAYGAAIGCVWYLCVAYRAGVLTWPI